MHWTVYLAGEIHSDWRHQLQNACQQLNLPVTLTAPVTDHAASDDCGVAILGPETDPFWHDHKSAKLNAIRTRTLIQSCDLLVVRFGDKYRQWNAAFDAGQALALNKPIIVMHDPALRHALKEIDAAALAVVQTPQEVADILNYVINAALDQSPT